MNCETELVDLGLSLKQKTYLGIITCKFMAYDCGLNLIRFFAAVNISLLARGDREKIQQMARAGLEPGPPDCDFLMKIKKQHQTNQNRKKMRIFCKLQPLPPFSYFF